jgi:hypothetical protein
MSHFESVRPYSIQVYLLGGVQVKINLRVENFVFLKNKAVEVQVSGVLPVVVVCSISR